MNDEQLTQRLQAASEAIEMSDAAQARHLNAISAALATDSSNGPVVSLSTATSRRRRIVASVVAAAVIAPTGLAAASEGSVPGEALYPVKQLSERVIVLFDSDVIARHRIEEIEALEDAAESSLIEDARRALVALGEDHPLWQRLASAIAHDGPAVELTIAGTTEEDDDGSEDDALAAAVEGVVLPDGTEALFTIVGHEFRSVEPPDGWTATALDDDGATLENGEYTVEIALRRDGSLAAEAFERTDRGADSDADESEDSEAATTSANHVSDDDSSEGPRGDEREDDSDSDGGGDPRDDDTSKAP